jgi:hypothetical protein
VDSIIHYLQYGERSRGASGGDTDAAFAEVGTPYSNGVPGAIGAVAGGGADGCGSGGALQVESS